jgi:hypothetical protein
MTFLIRMTIRLAVLALAADGAKSAYEDFVTPLRGPSREFVDHAKASWSITEDRVSDATEDFARDMQGAARKATDDAARNVSDQPHRVMTSS